MQGYRLEYMMSENTHRSKGRKQKFLAWVKKNKKFRTRRPTVAETMKAMRRGPLRSLVTQSQREAANLYYRSEAQYYLRHIEVIRVEVKTGEIYGKPVLAYPSVKRSQYGRIEEQDYTTMKRVCAEPSLRLSIRDQAWSDLEAWVARYERYTEFLEMFGPIVDMIKTVKRDIKVA